VVDARNQFAKLQADMEANLAAVEQKREDQRASFTMQGDDPAS